MQKIVSFEAVRAARAAMLSRGERPTVRSMREALGGGSFATIQQLIREVEAVELGAASQPEVQHALGEIWGHAVASADSHLRQRIAQLEAENASLRAQLEQKKRP